MPWILACAAFVIGLLAAERAGSRPAKAFAKMGAAFCFLGLALHLGALESSHGRTILAGLVLCAAGDALLLPAGQTLWFQLGIGSFLLGHLAYALAFFGFPMPPLALGLAAVGMTAFGAAALRWLRPHLPADFRIPVVAYVIVIGIMVVTAVAATTGGAPWAAAVGAIAFAVSDLSVARERFVTATYGNLLWGLPLYFGAQLSIASTVGAAP